MAARKIFLCYNPIMQAKRGTLNLSHGQWHHFRFFLRVWGGTKIVFIEFNLNSYYLKTGELGWFFKFEEIFSCERPCCFHGFLSFAAPVYIYDTPLQSWPTFNNTVGIDFMISQMYIILFGWSPILCAWWPQNVAISIKIIWLPKHVA